MSPEVCSATISLKPLPLLPLLRSIETATATSVTLSKSLNRYALLRYRYFDHKKGTIFFLDLALILTFAEYATVMLTRYQHLSFEVTLAEFGIEAAEVM